MSVCASFGFLSKDQLKKLKYAGVTRIHCNIETSENFFPSNLYNTYLQNESGDGKACKINGIFCLFRV
jgi:biotin synthase